MSKRWTPKHDNVLTKNAKHGYKTIQKNLLKKFGEHWAVSSIRRYAKKQMIEIGLSHSEVPLVWIMTHPHRKPEHQEAHPRLVKLAKAEGVARRSDSYGQKLCVPAWWADKICEEIEEHGEDYVFSRIINSKHRRKLTEQQAKEIIRLKGKVPRKKLAAKYNVSIDNIKSIQIGKSWRRLHAQQKQK